MFCRSWKRRQRLGTLRRLADDQIRSVNNIPLLIAMLKYDNVDRIQLDGR
jgi:hypothetical protein